MGLYELIADSTDGEMAPLSVCPRTSGIGVYSIVGCDDWLGSMSHRYTLIYFCPKLMLGGWHELKFPYISNPLLSHLFRFLVLHCDRKPVNPAVSRRTGKSI
jgi:hypothetical protein